MKNTLKTLISIATLSTLLVGCGGGGGSSTQSTGAAANLIKSINIYPDNIVLTKDTVANLTAIGTFENQSTKELTEKDITSQVVWDTTQNAASSVVATNSMGTITGVAAGPTTITAYLKDGGKTITSANSTTVTVTEATLNAITIKPGTTTLPVGSSSVFAAYGEYSDGEIVDISSQVDWHVQNNFIYHIMPMDPIVLTPASSIPATNSIQPKPMPPQNITEPVATIDPITHVITGKSVGEAIVSASWKNINTSNIIVLKVIPIPPTSIKISAPTLTVHQGEEIDLSAKGVYLDQEYCITGAVKWVSSDIDVAKIKRHGDLIALNPGTIKVSAFFIHPITKEKITSNELTIEVLPAIIPSAQGLWIGNTTSNRAMAGIVFNDGLYYFMYSNPNNPSKIGGVIQGNGTTQNHTFTSTNAKNFNIESLSVINSDITAHFAPQKVITGIINNTFGVHDHFKAVYNSDYELTPSLSALAGTFTSSIFTPYNIEEATVTLNNDGTLSGKGATGCLFTGTATARTDSNAFNFTISFNAAPCFFANQSLNGVAYFDAKTKQLYAAAPNETRTSGVVFVGSKP
jgi:hypothetical protein